MKQFEKVKVSKPNASVFDLSHEQKLSCDMGYLVPTLMEETLPGDKFKVNSEIFLRFMPMLAPIMHRVNVYMHYFWVPLRIIWDDFEEFITAGEDGTSVINHPKLTGTMDDFDAKFGIGSLADYLGYPVGNSYQAGTNQVEISQLPFRAYAKIYNDYYRDQSLQMEVVLATDSLDQSVNTSNLTALKRRCWEKDYFTSALPFAQRGNPVSLPLGDSAPIEFEPIYNNFTQVWDQSTNPPRFKNVTENVSIAGDRNLSGEDVLVNGGNSLISVDNSDNLTADLSNATAATISDLRTAFALQRWQEKNARGGSRYIEQVLSHFGVKSKDSRLQRAEYLGGGKMTVKISEVLQTAETSTDGPLGEMGGHGYTAGSSAKANGYFTEHGIVMGIMSIMPRTAYQNGIRRIWTKFDRFDYYTPDFAHIGEQPVKNKEIYLQGGDVDDQEWGYQPRYTEYRQREDSVHADMRDTLDYWHMGRKFSGLPALNDAFVNADVTNRIFNYTGEGEYKRIVAQIYHNFKAIRPVAKFGNPV